ncbi:hypothetical protein JCM1840_005381 [Sporobolomyces johnsonii]
MADYYQLQIPKLFGVSGKVALITGGGSGLGEMMATALVQNGAKVYIASRKEKQLKAVADRLTSAGPGSCEYLIADVGSKAGCDALIEKVKQKTDKLHILINNSGTTWGAELTDFPEREGKSSRWDRVLATNVKAIFYMTAGLSQLLFADATSTDPGRVVNISSIAGLDPQADNSLLSDPGLGLWSYNASKAAANHLTKSLAVTLGTKLVTVNAICPGVYPTKMTKHGFEHGEDQIKKVHPMGRPGAPEDIAGLMLFLVSRAGAHISGALIPTDGGSLVAGGRGGYARL